MAYQLSEMKAKYKGQVDLTSNLTPHPKQLQTATLADHFANGPTKVFLNYVLACTSDGLRICVSASINYGTMLVCDGEFLEHTCNDFCCAWIV